MPISDVRRYIDRALVGSTDLIWNRSRLDSIWYLAPAHGDCNGRESNRPPTADEVRRLVAPDGHAGEPHCHWPRPGSLHGSRHAASGPHRLRVGTP
jgi:hypothetical protein